jgi:exopolysaccharide biosynthesis polyprenyl glycosylphosphotransferase
MSRRFSVNFVLLAIVLDGLLIIVSLLAANYLRPPLSFLPFANAVRRPMQLPVTLYPIFTGIWIGIFMIMSVYDGRKNLRMANEMTNVMLGSLLAGVSLAGTLYLSYREVSRVLFVAFILLATFSLASWRLTARFVFRYVNRKLCVQRRVLVIGAGRIGRELREKIINTPDLGYYFVGFLDDDEKKRLNNPEIIGALDEARKVVDFEEIDDVVIALPLRAHVRINKLVAELHDLPVKVLVVPDYYHLALHKAVVQEFAGMAMLDLRAPALNDYQRLVKRAFDLVISILVLPLSLLIMGTIALLIRLQGSGSILFKQQRVGENGRLFEIYKFRTMVPNAEEMLHIVEKRDAHGALVHKHESDPRVTPVGHILRRTSLDELPQLFNVIRGDMSLIGPRPELPYLVKQYKPWQHKRFAVPQGITGWWQVNGRSDKPMHLHTEDDLYYVQNYSLLLDLRILLRTFAVVFKGKGAF